MKTKTKESPVLGSCQWFGHYRRGGEALGAEVLDD